MNPVFLFVPRLTCEGEGGGCWEGLNLTWPGEMLLEREDWEGEEGMGQEEREEEGRKWKGVLWARRHAGKRGGMGGWGGEGGRERRRR